MNKSIGLALLCLTAALAACQNKSTSQEDVAAQEAAPAASEVIAPKPPAPPGGGAPAPEIPPEVLEKIRAAHPPAKGN